MSKRPLVVSLGQGRFEFTGRYDFSLQSGFDDTMIDALRIDDTIEAYSHDVFEVCRRNSRCTEDAWDAFQETFLVFARRHPELDKSEDLRPWLRETARRCSLAVCRKAEAHKLAANSGSVESVESSDPSLDVTELIEILRHEVAELPDHERQLISLIYQKGCSHRDVSVKLSIPAGSVHAALTKTLNHLRSRLRKRRIVFSGLLSVFLLHQSAQADVAEDKESKELQKYVTPSARWTWTMSGLKAAITVICLGGLTFATMSQLLPELRSSWTEFFPGISNHDVKSEECGDEVVDEEMMAFESAKSSR